MFKRDEKLTPVRVIIVFAVVCMLMPFVFEPIQRSFGMTGLMFTWLMLLVIAMAVVFAFNAPAKEVFSIKLPKVKHFFGAAFLWLGVFFAMDGINIVIMNIFPKHAAETQYTFEFAGGGTAVMIIIAAVILPAISQEALHRGVILSGMKDAIKNKALLVAVMGAIFGVFYLNPFRFFSVAILGMALTYMLIQSKSIVLPVLFHIVHNFIVVSASLTSQAQAAEETVQSFQVISIYASLLFAGFAFIPLYLGMRLLSDEGKEHKPYAAVVAVSLSAVLILVGSTATTLDSGIYEYNFETEITENLEVTDQISCPAASSYTLKLEYNGECELNITITAPSGEQVYNSETDESFKSDIELTLGKEVYVIRYNFKPASQSDATHVEMKTKIVPKT